MTQNEYLDILNKLDEAQESTRPFAIQTDEEIVVAGDANDTKINTSDFVVEFRIPQKVDGVIRYKTSQVEYKDVYITPRQDVKVIKAMVDLLPYYRKIEANGGLGDYTDEEIYAFVTQIPDEIYDKMYDLVAVVLGVDDRLKDFMLQESVITNVGRIIEAYPEAVNEADSFFEKSSAKPFRTTPR